MTSPRLAGLRNFVLVSITLFLGFPCLADSPVVPSLPVAADYVGHWEGSVQTLFYESRIRVDIWKDAKGALAAGVDVEADGRRCPTEPPQADAKGIQLKTLDGDILTGQISRDRRFIQGTLVAPGQWDLPMPFALERSDPGSYPAVFPFREKYTKTEYRIPMRDGIELYTAVYAPKDPTGTHPMLMSRSPYSNPPYGPEFTGFTYVNRFLEPYARDGYILVFQDVRGRYQSQGKFVHFRPILPDVHDAKAVDESTDTYDTIEWLVKRVPHNNGKVGMYGISYLGTYAAMGLVRSHPALKAVSPQAPMIDWFVGDDMHRNGASCPDLFFFLTGMFGPETNYPAKDMAEFTEPGPDGYRYFLQAGAMKNLVPRDVKGWAPFFKESLEHPNYDAFWQSRNLRPHLRDVRPAVLTVGGWFDGEDMFGALQCFKSIERQSPATENHLVMGPWHHGQWVFSNGENLGQSAWGQATSEFFNEKILKPFFDHHLMGAADPGLSKAYAFEVGGRGWRDFDAWPPSGTRSVSYYLQEQGRLATARSGEGPAFDEFVSDPAKPVPYMNTIANSHTAAYLVDDQRFAATRPDVLVYESEPLTEDLTAVGPVKADLWVSTTGTDSDWVVKVIDEHPDNEDGPFPNPHGYANGGYQELVRADVMRGRFRSSFEKPEPFTPGQPTEVAWALNDVLHTFKKGHRIVVQVQCSWFPLVDRNPQTFTNINTAAEKDFIKATQRVYHTPDHASRVEMALLPSREKRQ